MKKKKIDFESGGWSGSRHLSAIRLIETFFQFYDLPTAKNLFAEIMEYSQKEKVLKEENPSEIFHFYLSLRSLIRAAWQMQSGSEKKKFQIPAGPFPDSLLIMGSLSEEEYGDPLRVLQKTFRELSIRDFDGFLSDIICFSLGTFRTRPERELFRYWNNSHSKTKHTTKIYLMWYVFILNSVHNKVNIDCGHIFLTLHIFKFMRLSF